jgi:hypothetical protein
VISIARKTFTALLVSTKKQINMMSKMLTRSWLQIGIPRNTLTIE